MPAVMLAALALAAVQAAAVEPSPTPVEEVVITAKLRRIRYSFTVRGGKLARWRVEQSTGEPFLDSLVKDAASRCAAIPPVTTTGMIACIEAAKPKISAAAAAHRVEAPAR